MANQACLFIRPNFIVLLAIPAEIQLLFVADLKHKRMSQIEGAKKHGRNIVTFLLITNLGLWITYNFEIQKVHKIDCFTEFYR